MVSFFNDSYVGFLVLFALPPPEEEDGPGSGVGDAPDGSSGVEEGPGVGEDIVPGVFPAKFSTE